MENDVSRDVSCTSERNNFCNCERTDEPMDFRIDFLILTFLFQFYDF